MRRTIVVTGSNGLIGWHLSVFLQTLSDQVDLIRCNREQFNNDEFLNDAISKAHVVVHLAGMNRGEEDEIVSTNIALAQRLVDTCTALDCRPQIIYSSSTHIDGPTKYGYSKRTAGEILGTWAEAEDARFCNLVLPHVFGALPIADWFRLRGGRSSLRLESSFI